MARMKLTARKHVRAPPRRNVAPTVPQRWSECWLLPEDSGTVLLALGSSKPPLFIGTSRLLHGNSYLWRVCVVIYERPTTDHIHNIRQVVKAPTPRWTSEGGKREAAREALAIPRHEGMSKWCIHSTATSRAKLKKERKLW
jgi:hypothetical protein